MVLNEIYNKIEITKKLGFSQNCEHAKINTWYFRSAPQRFQKFPEFVQYSKNEKNQIVSERKPAFQIKSPSILQEQAESAIYNLLSNSVHGLPLGLGSNSINYTYFFHSFFKAEQLLVISLQISCVYTAYYRQRLFESQKTILLIAYTGGKEESEIIHVYYRFGELYL